VEALGIEPRSGEGLYPASTCLVHLLDLAVKTPMDRIFTASLGTNLVPGVPSTT